MGLFSSLFGGKKEPKVTIKVQPTVIRNAGTSVKEETPLKSVDTSIQDLVLLSLAENYKVGEKKYPNYFRSSYGIGFPNERFQQLAAAGMIRPSTAIEALPHLKASELKAIATNHGLKASGKKEDLCSRISENVLEAEVANEVPDRYWVVTDSGKNLLDENKYIGFYIESHRYSLESIGLDINSYAKLFANKPNGRVRDVLWGEFNKKSTKLYAKGMTKGEFDEYCDLLQTMALFLEEESRHKDALALYLRYLHYRANYKASLSALKTYNMLKKYDKTAVDSAANYLFNGAEIYPFMAEDIQTMCYGCGFDSQQLYQFMVEMLSKETDTGIFSPTELSNLIMCGMNGDRAGQEAICKTAMVAAIKKLPK